MSSVQGRVSPENTQEPGQCRAQARVTLNHTASTDCRHQKPEAASLELVEAIRQERARQAAAAPVLTSGLVASTGFDIEKFIGRHIPNHLRPALSADIESYIQAPGTQYALGPFPSELLVRRYGPGIDRELAFVQEYTANLALFENQIGPSSLDRSDLLARIALSNGSRLGFANYDRRDVDAIREYARSALKELVNDYRREGNSLDAWEAFRYARTYQFTIPDIVLEYLDGVAGNLKTLQDKAAEGSPPRRGAEAVAQAMGFTSSGPGRGNEFTHAVLLRRDRMIYQEMVRLLRGEKSRKVAIHKVAKKVSVTERTVKDAYYRIRKIAEE